MVIKTDIEKLVQLIKDTFSGYVTYLPTLQDKHAYLRKVDEYTQTVKEALTNGRADNDTTASK